MHRLVPSLFLTATLACGVGLPALSQVPSGEPQQADRTSESLIDELEKLSADLANSRLIGLPSVAPPPADEIGATHWRERVTDMRFGGERVVILLDSSRSMLSSELFDEATLASLTLTERRESPKWRRAIDIVNWLAARVSAESSVQIILYNDHARFLDESGGLWIARSDTSRLETALSALREDVVPSGEKNLQAAFRMLQRLGSEPSNVYLITDGLPNRSDDRGRNANRRGERHLRYAELELTSPSRINVVLMPLSVEPEAAAAYWTLALKTGGSLLAPAAAWPSNATEHADLPQLLESLSNALVGDPSLASMTMNVLQVRMGLLALRTTSTASGELSARLAAALDSLTGELRRQQRTYEPVFQRPFGIDSRHGHLVFVIDASGSMHYHWDRVRRQVAETLDAYPDLQAFQIMSDSGQYLLDRFEGSWIPDTREHREEALAELLEWRPYSDSMIDDGIVLAIERHYEPGRSVAVHVLADTHDGNPRRAIERTREANRRDDTGVPKLQISATVFPTYFEAARILDSSELLMAVLRELTESSGGSLIGLQTREALR